MKASDLIAMVQSFIDKEGDREIIVRDIVHGDDYEICSISKYFDGEAIHIEI